MNYKEMTPRELDRENNRIMAWNDFWTTFERITLGDPAFASHEGVMSDLERRGLFPPRDFLKSLREEVHMSHPNPYSQGKRDK